MRSRGSCYLRRSAWIPARHAGLCFTPATRSPGGNMADRPRPNNHADADGYVFADRDELDGVIGNWQNEGDDIRGAGDLLTEAYYSIRSPASDVITQGY